MIANKIITITNKRENIIKGKTNAYKEYLLKENNKELKKKIKDFKEKMKGNKDYDLLVEDKQRKLTRNKNKKDTKINVQVRAYQEHLIQKCHKEIEVIKTKMINKEMKKQRNMMKEYEKETKTQRENVEECSHMSTESHALDTMANYFEKVQDQMENNETDVSSLTDNSDQRNRKINQTYENVTLSQSVKNLGEMLDMKKKELHEDETSQTQSTVLNMLTGQKGKQTKQTKEEEKENREKKTAEFRLRPNWVLFSTCI